MGLAALVPWLYGRWRYARAIPGRIVGANSKFGHRLREGGFPAANREEELDVAIVGGGVAGLSCAWRLKRKGFENFRLFELDQNVGGNAASGENEISAYPWGAHYIPIAGEDSTHLRGLFEECGVITGHDERGRPIYNDLYLCQEPQERLFIKGRWQDTLVPQIGVAENERAEFAAFFDHMAGWRHKRGADGRFLFHIPLELSSSDPETRELDRISMKEFLDQNGWHSPHLHWYVNYCCRDDYGATYDRVSAWAGAHYFAARGGVAANTEPFSVVTWPEGNGWMTRYLVGTVEGHVSTGRLVIGIEKRDRRHAVLVYDAEKNETTTYLAKSVVIAAPRFVAARLLKEAPPAEFEYAPWMTANVTLKALPSEGHGAKLSWDNVCYDSPGLGYVDATHQKIERYKSRAVLTYYWPLSHLAPNEARQEALKRTHAEWCAMVIAELERTHPDIRQDIVGIDVWLWGHGMIIPRPGFLWGDARTKALEGRPGLHFAHSDMSGISIFEEAQYRGVEAADRVLREVRG